MATQTSWRMRGDVMEACSCATTCPCNFGSDPTPLPCEVVLGWRIQEGNYGDTRLDGLSVVLYGLIPGNVFHGNGPLASISISEPASSRRKRSEISSLEMPAAGRPC